MTENTVLRSDIVISRLGQIIDLIVFADFAFITIFHILFMTLVRSTICMERVNILFGFHCLKIKVDLPYGTWVKTVEQLKRCDNNIRNRLFDQFAIIQWRGAIVELSTKLNLDWLKAKCEEHSLKI